VDLQTHDQKRLAVYFEDVEEARPWNSDRAKYLEDFEHFSRSCGLPL